MTNLNVVGGPKYISETMPDGSVARSETASMQDAESIEELARRGRPDLRGTPSRNLAAGLVLFHGLQLTQARFNELFQGNADRPGGRGR